jgi:uncharacterized Zn finger protein
MNKCQNPECGKELSEGKTYCDENCLRKHQELKRLKKLEVDEEEWLGQGRRKRAVEKIMKLAKKLLPMSYKHFACTVSYRTGLSLRKVTDDYLEVLIELDLLKRNDGALELGRPEP